MIMRQLRQRLLALDPGKHHLRLEPQASAANPKPWPGVICAFSAPVPQPIWLPSEALMM